ncbi:MAG: tetratricopeptide repeat protein [Nannocystaceae bacterium]
MNTRLRQHLQDPRLRRPWLVLLLTASLTPWPLVGTPGYENSLALSAPMALFGVAIGVDGVRRLAKTPPASGNFLALLARRGLSEVGWLLALSLAILLVALAWQTNCDPVMGLAFFAMGPGLCGVLGWACGIWGGILARHRSIQLTLGYTPIFACLGVSLWRLYHDPVVFALDPFWGYFAGPLYDEAVAINARYLWFRAYNLLGLTAALSSFYLATALPKPPSLQARLRRSPWVAGLAFVSLVATATLATQTPRFAFTATVESLSEALSGRRATEHFVIHYAPGSATARDIELVAAEHEFAWAQLQGTLGRAPRAPVHSFVFPSPAVKRHLLGAGRTEVAPPWRGHIYLNHAPYPHVVLQHELAHAFSYTVGDRLFGVPGSLGPQGLRVNLALVEGFATALAPRANDRLDLHDQAVVLDLLGKRPPLSDIMGFGFWGKASRQAYTAAGSFCLWLLETYGVDGLVGVYANAGDFDAVYGMSLVDLEAQWVGFLKARSVDTRDIEAQRERFRRRPIFARPCAHRAANLIVEATRAQTRGEPTRGLELLSELCAIEPEKPKNHLRLAYAEASVGDYDGAQQTLRDLQSTADLSDSLLGLADERLGDLALAKGELTEARSAYESALGRHLSESRTRVLQIKHLATGEATDTRLATAVHDYFAPFDLLSGKLTRAVRRLDAAHRIGEVPKYAALSDYLIGRQLLNISAGDRAAMHLHRSLHPAGTDTLPSIELVRAARLALIEAHVRQRDFDAAEAVLATLRLEASQHSGHQLVEQRWQHRLTFLRGYLDPK